MRRKDLAILVLFLSILFLIKPFSASATPNGVSVGECIEHPEKCGGEGSTTKGDKAEEKEDPSLALGFMDVVKMFFALLFVVVLLYFLMKLMNKNSRAYQQNRLVQNIGGTALGGNRSVQIVKAGNRLLVVGVGEEVRLLREITDKKEIEDLLDQYSTQLDTVIQPKHMAIKLLDTLKENLGQKSKNEDKDKSFKKLFESEMNQIKKDRKNSLQELKWKEHDRNE